MRRKFGNYSRKNIHNANLKSDNNHNNNTHLKTYITNKEKNHLFKQYIQIKKQKMKALKNENSYNNKRTPIYNSYVPGSGVGASNIATRRHKQKYAYLH
jgi:hypothetical protein